MNKLYVVIETNQGPLVAGLVSFPTLEALALALNGGVPPGPLRCLMVENPETGKGTLVNTASGYAKMYER